MNADLTVLIHIPYPLEENPRIAPQIRPQRMIEAFEGIGCSTLVVSGTGKQRKRQMENIKSRIRKGSLHVDFVYSESAGWPNAFSGGKKTFHPFLDEHFLQFMKNAGIPVSLFFRDAYHRANTFFDVPATKLPLRHLLKAMCERDLKRYNKYVDILYLPSTQMHSQVPEYLGTVLELPPGAIPKNSNNCGVERVASQLRLIYVGGLGPLYRLHKVFEAVMLTSGVHLTVCTRVSDWAATEGEYLKYLGASISVVHMSGTELEELYESADLAIIAFEPNSYRDFAVPVKLFEYIGRGLAIVASSGTLAGTYVDEHHLGWSVPYTTEDLAGLFSHLASPENFEFIETKSIAVINHSLSVSWECRAQQVVDDFLS